MAAELILFLGLAYLVIGVISGFYFVWRVVSTIDPAAQGTNWTFRLLILPGTIALWPVVVARFGRAFLGRKV